MARTIASRGRRWRWAAAVTLLAFAACFHNTPEDDADAVPRPDPIPVHVKNENFSDMNVYAVVSGVSRRIGTVQGNSEANFTIDWPMAYGQFITINAIPIGGRGGATTGSLSVGAGQMIDFRVSSILRQSSVSVHEPF
jgi:hypothetical protein